MKSEPLSAADHSPRVTHVVAGAVTDSAGRILIAQRPRGKQLAGSWEFPGGKLEPGEPRACGLARELKEELGIDVRQPRPLTRVRHSYAFGEVLIDMWVVSRYSGEPQSLDGQALRWCLLDELASADLLPADRPIVRALRLPERLTTTWSPGYVVRAAADESSSGASAISSIGGEDPAPSRAPLRGTFCADVAEASQAAAAGAAFLVMNDALPAAEVERLCASVPVPVYVRGKSLEAAWLIGATGLNDIAP